MKAFVFFIAAALLVPPTAPPPTSFDIVAYGAVPNDGLDDTPAIRAACEAAGQAGGGRVFSSLPGVFTIERQTENRFWGFVLPSNVTFDGTGIVLKNGTSVTQSSSAFWTLGCDGCSNVTVKNVTIDGSFEPPYADGDWEQIHTIAFFNASNVTLDDVTTHNVSGNGVYFGSGTEDITVTNSLFYEFGRGAIGIAGGGLGRSGFYIVNNIMIVPAFYNNERDIDIEVANQISNVQIVYNTVSREMEIGGVDDCFIYDNHVGEGGLQMIHVTGSTVTKNTLSGPLYCGNCDYTDISNNLISAEGSVAAAVISVRMQGPENSTGVSVRENQIVGRGQAGILAERCEDLLIKGNSIVGDFAFAARLLDGHSALLAANSLSGTDYGLSVEAGTRFPFVSLTAVENYISGGVCDVRIIVDVPILTCVEDNELAHGTRCFTGTTCR